MDSESYLDDPGDLLTNLDPPLTSLKVLSPEIITVSTLQMSNTGNHCRTGASSSSLVKLGGAFYLHNMMVVLMDMSCKSMGCFFFKLAVVIEGFGITSPGHTTLVPSVVFFPVPAILAGMVLSGQMVKMPFAVCFRREKIACLTRASLRLYGQ